uniref:Uncharacterized protein n=1 Tax=viral metagenome TaxID=1070528 RepID=A0A6M3LFE9_9ZZZZ
MTYRTTLKIYFKRAIEVVRNMPEYKEQYHMVDNQGNFPDIRDYLINVHEVKPGIYREV